MLLLLLLHSKWWTDSCACDSCPLSLALPLSLCLTHFPSLFISHLCLCICEKLLASSLKWQTSAAASNALPLPGSRRRKVCFNFLRFCYKGDGTTHLASSIYISEFLFIAKFWQVGNSWHSLNYIFFFNLINLTLAFLRHFSASFCRVSLVFNLSIATELV